LRLSSASLGPRLPAHKPGLGIIAIEAFVGRRLRFGFALKPMLSALVQKASV
jgi:hypothetical protein